MLQWGWLFTSKIMKVRFNFLTGDVNWSQYGGTWISQKFNNSDTDYWLVREIINWESEVNLIRLGNIQLCCLRFALATTPNTTSVKLCDSVLVMTAPGEYF
jgi:hypothetical protein